MAALPPPTPPAYVRQLAERVEEQHRELSALRSKQGADALSVQHQLGWIAGWVLAIGRHLGIDAKAVKPVHFDVPPSPIITSSSGPTT